MYRVQFEDFRCFGKAAQVEIRPITLLIGENSAGKTSFLAGLRFALESFSGGAVNPFNRDPYFLGGFDQIAHIGGGGRRGAEAKSFHISVQTSDFGSVGAREGVGSHAPEHRFSFTKGGAQPQLSHYAFSINGDQLSVSLADDQVKTTISRNGESIPIPDQARHFSRSNFLLHDISILPLILQDFVMAPRHPSSKPSRPPGAAPPGREEDHQCFLDRLANSLRTSSRALSQSVFSSAPVRSQPLRTYTPSEVAASSEGAHVPLALSRAKANDAKDWTAIREGLVAFGQSSGLFKDIDVKAFGKGDADPFQIMVNIAGTAMNLADVGYGVSQVLPIIYQIQNSSRHETFLLQQPEVHLHPRAQAELGSLFVSMVARKNRRKPAFVIETHSDYLVDRVRIEVANGKISPDNVTIVFFQRGSHESCATNLYLNDRGEILDVPENFRAFFLAEHLKLLGF